MAAGAGSVARWLSEQVGNSGKVVVIDNDTTLLSGIDESNITILCQGVEDLDDDLEFDLVHARLILDLLPSRDKVLDKLINCVRPGGWILLEEFDSITFIPNSNNNSESIDLFVKVVEAVRDIWLQDRHDPEYGRKLPGELLKRGLQEVAAEGHVLVRRGGTPGVIPWQLSVEKIRDRIVDLNLLSHEEIERHQALLHDPSFTYLTPLLLSTWGRVPAE